MMTQATFIPDGFDVFPTIFLQSGFPLKLSVYIWTVRKDVPPVLFRARGSVLELDEMLSLRKLSDRQVLALRCDILEAMEYYEEDPLYSPQRNQR